MIASPAAPTTSWAKYQLDSGHNVDPRRARDGAFHLDRSIINRWRPNDHDTNYTCNSGRTPVPGGPCDGTGSIRQGCECTSLPRGTANRGAAFGEAYQAVKCQCQSPHHRRSSLWWRPQDRVASHGREAIAPVAGGTAISSGESV